jgi:hypothetical protein
LRFLRSGLSSGRFTPLKPIAITVPQHFIEVVSRVFTKRPVGLHQAVFPLIRRLRRSFCFALEVWKKIPGKICLEGQVLPGKIQGAAPISLARVLA